MSNDEIRVLHVDDAPDFAAMVAEFLEREQDGFVVETATSVERGLDILARTQVDCVVSDYEMPARTGIEFLEAVRADYPDLPFVLYTGKGSEEIASEAISAGVTDYLQKEGGTSQYTVLANRVANAVEQYRSRRPLEASRKRPSLFVEQSSLGLIEWDEDFNVGRIDGAAADILGFDEAALVGRSWEAIVSDADAAAVAEVVEQLLEAEGGHHSINENVTADGETIICEWHNRVVTNDEGDVVAIFSQFQDVTDRRRRQEELERHRAIVEAARPTILTVDESGTILSANPSVRDTFGYGPGDVEGEPVTVLMDDETAASHEAAFERYLRSGEPTTDWDSGEFVGKHRDGTAIPLSITISEVSYEGDHYFVGILRDRTEQARRVERLELLNELTGDLLQAETRIEVAELGVEAASGILGLDANAIHLYDEADDALVPVAATDAVYELIDDLPTFTGDDSIAWSVFVDGEPLALDDVGNHPDLYNPATPVASELHLPLGDDGILVAGSETPAAFDKSDLVLGEILAGNVTTALEQVERTATLREREQELWRQNERLEAFASVVSHDLRNPLTVADGHLELLAEEVESEHVDAIDRAHTRMNELIEDLLVLARRDDAEAGAEPVDLSEVAESSWQNVATKTARLETAVDGRIMANRSRLQQLLENLFRNAVEHGGDGVTVTVGGLDTGFYVADDGAGFESENLDDAFTLGASTTDGGSGLGLAIVEMLAESAGWTVAVTESAEDGARIEIMGVDTAD
jgi:PAS domain S-box-containing protein